MTTKEKIEVMQAYVDGKQIQSRNENWGEWETSYVTVWDWASKEYRIKPEPKYVPYKDTSEMIKDYCDRFGVERKDYEEPIIWIAKGNVRKMINSFHEDSVTIIDANELYFASTLYMRTLFYEYTYLDGSPVGKLVEE